MQNNNIEILRSANNPYGFWTVNGSRSFGTIPAGIVPFAEGDIPICLQQGNPSFGYEHFQKRKERLIRRFNMGIPELIFNKCQQPGKIHYAQDKDRITLYLTLHPSLLLVLEFKSGDPPFFTIITIYDPRDGVDGEVIGRYPGSPWNGGALVFTGPTQKEPPIAYVRKRKILLLPPKDSAGA